MATDATPFTLKVGETRRDGSYIVRLKSIVGDKATVEVTELPANIRIRRERRKQRKEKPSDE